MFASNISCFNQKHVFIQRRLNLLSRLLSSSSFRKKDGKIEALNKFRADYFRHQSIVIMAAITRKRGFSLVPVRKGVTPAQLLSVVLH